MTDSGTSGALPSAPVDIGQIRRTSMHRWIVLTVSVSLAISRCVLAWHDTTYINMKRLQRIARMQAEDIVTDKANTADAPEALGKKVAILRPGGARLTFEREFPIGHYRVEMYGVVPDGKDDYFPDYILVHLKIAPLGAGDPEREWAMRIAYRTPWPYDDLFGCSVPIYRKGRYRVELWSDSRSRKTVHADFVDVRDVLAGCAKKAAKTGRYLWTEEEVKAMRADAEPTPDLTPEEKRVVFDSFDWEPDRYQSLNRQTIGDMGVWQRNFRKYLQGPQFDETKIIKTDGWGDFYPAAILSDEFRQKLPTAPGLTVPCACPFRSKGWKRPPPALRRLTNLRWNKPPLHEQYLRTGDPRIAFGLACILVSTADRFPGRWFHTESAAVNLFKWRGLRFTPTNVMNQAHGSKSGPGENLLLSYDAVFPWLKDNEEFAKRVGEHIPYVKTARDVCALIETNIIQLSADLHIRRIMRGEGGRWDQRMTLLCAVQGPNEVSEPWMRALFSRAFWNGTNNGGLHDHAICSLQREGSTNIGATGYAQGGSLAKIAAGLARFRRAGGEARYDLGDPQRYPQVVSGAVFAYANKVAGGYMPNVGDWFNFVRNLSPTRLGSEDNLRFHFERTGDPRSAYVLKHYFKALEPAIDAAAAKCAKDPILHAESRVLPGFGLAILEAGSEYDDFTKKRAAVLRTGYGRGHGHHDQLSIEYFAKGVRAVPDTGARRGSPYPRNTDVHFCVQVDDQTHKGAELNATGVGWEEAFVPLPGAQFVSAGARAQSHPQVSFYRRDVALVDSGPADSYLVDCFRIEGGTIRTWGFHSMGPGKGESPIEHLNCEMKPSTTALAGMSQFHDVEEGVVTGDDFQVVYDTPVSVQKYYLRDAYGEGRPPLHTSATLFGVKGSQVFAGGHKPGSEYYQSRRYIKVRTTDVPPAGTTHLTLTDAYNGKSLIKGSRELEVTGDREGAFAARAVEVSLAEGATDTLVFGSGKTATGVTADGRFAMCRRQAGGISLLQIVNGIRVEAEGYALQLDRAAYETVVEEADLDADSFARPKDWPRHLVRGEQCFLDTHGHRTSARIVDARRRTVQLKGPLKIYQSEITRINEGERYVVTRIEPPALICQKDYYENCIAAAENRRKHWRVRIVPSAIWVYLQNPRHDWTTIYTDADFPDSDGDGKRRFTFEDFGTEKRTVHYEIDYFDEKAQILYLKIPDGDEEMATNGWIHAHCPMYSEGKKFSRGRSIYTGKTYRIYLDGEPVGERDFTDEDNDGRRVLNMLQFGRGTRAVVATYAQLRRVGPKKFELRANAAARLSIPGAKQLRIGKRALKSEDGAFRVPEELITKPCVVVGVE